MKKKIEKRGKWARDPWIRILELLSKMSPEERQRCIRATAQFYGEDAKMKNDLMQFNRFIQGHVFPKWKQLIWRIFGVKRVGIDAGCKTTMYYFNGIYFVSKTEPSDEKRPAAV